MSVSTPYSVSLFLLLLVLSPLCCSALRRDNLGKIVELNEDNWRTVLKGEWMILFFAPWCPACRALHPTWADFSDWTEDLELDGIAQVDVTENPGLSGRFLVTSLPTIYHVKDGVFHQYRGARDRDSFIAVVEERQWKEMESIPGWKYPDSYQMSLVSMFFKMSMFLRHVHQTITEDYQMPPYVSYILFAVATILLGGFLGIVLVLCVDFVYPVLGTPPHEHGRHHQQQQDGGGAEGERREQEKDQGGSGDAGDGGGDGGDESQEDDEGEEEDGGGETEEEEVNSQEEEEEEEVVEEEEKTIRRRRAKKAD